MASAYDNMSTEAIPLSPLVASHKRVGPPLAYGGKIAGTGIRGKGGVVLIIARVTTAYLQSFSADYHRAIVSRYQSEVLDRDMAIRTSRIYTFTRSKRSKRRHVLSAQEF